MLFYCGYAEALATGSSLARQGIRIVPGQSQTISWKEVSRQYRKYLFVHGSLNTKSKRPAFDLDTAQTVGPARQRTLPARTLKARFCFAQASRSRILPVYLLPPSVCLQAQTSRIRVPNSILVFFHFASYLTCPSSYLMQRSVPGERSAESLKWVTILAMCS
jgi:hypothetical protein